MTRLRNLWFTIFITKNHAYFRGYNAGLKAGRTAAYKAMNARLDSVLEVIDEFSGQS